MRRGRAAGRSYAPGRPIGWLACHVLARESGIPTGGAARSGASCEDRSARPGSGFSPTRRRSTMSLRTIVVGGVSGVALAFAVAPASAESVQPTKGQSAEQMQKDVAECQGAATKSSGYDPSAPPPVSSAGAPQAGGRARGAAAGAVAGAAAAEVRGRQHEEIYDAASDEAKQEYRQNQAKSAAAAGAVVGGSRQRQERRGARREEQAQTSAANAAQTAYQQAYQGCLAGRGYTVTP